jgi:hypothetical protein
MISLLPKDGKTVDLLEWWYRFTLDASTEYLFGESVNSLLNPKVPSFLNCGVGLTAGIVRRRIFQDPETSIDPKRSRSFLAILQT